MKNIFTGSPNESLGFLLARVYALRSKRMNEELQSIELNYVHYSLLAGLYWLELEGKSVNQMMLIRFTKLDKSVVSTILQNMSKQGYVSRIECPDDTRAKIVTFTPQGKKLIEQAIQIVNGVDETFWGRNSTEPICDFFQEVIKINS